MKIGSQHLYSYDKSKLIHFLTSVFDAEIIIVHENFTEISIETIKFRLLESKAKKNNWNKNEVCIHLHLTCEDDLKSFISRLNFYCYKEKLEDVIIAKDNDSLQFVDPDGRLWLFTHKS